MITYRGLGTWGVGAHKPTLPESFNLVGPLTSEMFQPVLLDRLSGKVEAAVLARPAYDGESWEQ